MNQLKDAEFKFYIIIATFQVLFLHIYISSKRLKRRIVRSKFEYAVLRKAYGNQLSFRLLHYEEVLDLSKTYMHYRLNLGLRESGDNEKRHFNFTIQRSIKILILHGIIQTPITKPKEEHVEGSKSR